MNAPHARACSSPSSINLRADFPGPLAGPTTFTSWFQSTSGTVGGRIELADFAPGQMDATLRPAPGSEMATLLETTTPTPLLGLPFRYCHGEARLLAPQQAVEAKE